MTIENMSDSVVPDSEFVEPCISDLLQDWLLLWSKKMFIQSYRYFVRK